MSDENWSGSIGVEGHLRIGAGAKAIFLENTASALTVRTAVSGSQVTTSIVPASQPFVGEAPLEIFYDSATFNGTLDPIMKMGSNPRWTGSQSACYWGVEGDYNDGTNHLHEAYLNYDSADKSTVVSFRPIYIAVRKNANANHAATILFDVGTDGFGSGSSFAIQAGAGTTFLTINSAGAFFATAMAVKIGTAFVASMPTTTQASVWGHDVLSPFETTRVANTIYIVAINVMIPCTLTGIQVGNGSTVSGNILVGLYNAAGTTKLAASASTAQSGTFGVQLIPFSSPLAVQPGTYFATYVIDNAVGHVYCGDATCDSGANTQGSFTLPTAITVPTGLRAGNNPKLTTY